MKLVMKVLNFLSLEKIIARLNRRMIYNICINVFCYENDLTYPVHKSDQKFKYCMNLLLITNKHKLHYNYSRDFHRLMCSKTRNKYKNTFVSIVYNALVVKKF